MVGRKLRIENDPFIEGYNKAKTDREAASLLGVTMTYIRNRAFLLRKMGADLVKRDRFNKKQAPA